MHPGLEKSPNHFCHEQFELAFDQNWQVSAMDAKFRSPDHFMPGSLSLCWKFWEQHILVDHPLKQDILSWLKFGVHLEKFLAPFLQGSYNGVRINSRLPQTYREHNHVPHEFQDWVASEVTSLLKMGVLKRWDPASMGAPCPVVVAPLIVEPTKPRLIYDARYINCFLSLPSVEMFGIGKIPSTCWKGMYLVTLDHKSGYYHVPIHPDCWKYFGVSWKGELLCYVTLTFGWSPSAFIYCTLTGACSAFTRKITIAPVLDWVDDVLTGTSALHKNLSHTIQFQSANRTSFILAMVLYFAGYYINLPKSNLFPLRVVQFLGILVDSAQAMFYVPPKKVEDLIQRISCILNSEQVSVAQIESLVGKCRNMAHAVPAAALYTRAQYAALARALASSASPAWARMHDSIPISNELREELSFWLDLRSTLINGGHWLSPAHCFLNLTDFQGYCDASSRRSGGMVASSSMPFETAEDFGPDMTHQHINVKETAAFWKLLDTFLPLHSQEVRHKKLICHTDSQVLYFAFYAQGSTANLHITNYLKKIFWLQHKFECHVELKWIPSRDNLADPLTRTHVLEDLRLRRSAFLHVWKQFGPFSIDLMASPSNTQRMPNGTPLPFISQYCVKGALAVDVFSIPVGTNVANEGLPYCFPPFAMIDIFLAHLQECKGTCVVILPQTMGLWFPKYKISVKKVVCLAKAHSSNVLLCFKNNAFQPFKSAYPMLAALLDFSV